MGAPLESNFRNESQPDSVNGHDHTTVCGWFPKGYNLSTADKPPERGVQLTCTPSGRKPRPSSST
jgi:hypothetical protein